MFEVYLLALFLVNMVKHMFDTATLSLIAIKKHIQPLIFFNYLLCIPQEFFLNCLGEASENKNHKNPIKLNTLFGKE